jgi:death-on-curing protein
MTEPVWILKPAILAVHSTMIARFGGSEGLRDEGLLDSALARPLNLCHYEDCTDLPRLAAAYAAGIVSNHPFVDGNKRSGFMAAYMFLTRNGLSFKAEETAVVTMTRSLAASEIEETDYATWLDQNSS